MTTRTLRDSSGTPGFARLLERERERLQRPRSGSARTKPSTRPAPANADEQGREREREPTAPAPAPADEAFAAIEARRLDSYARWLDSNDARRGKLTPAELRARGRR